MHWKLNLLFGVCFLLFFVGANSNRLALFEHNVTPSVNVSDEIYAHKLYTILKENQTEGLAWGLSPNCSLQHQLSEAAEGTGLAFIVFTQAIVSLPGAPFWAVLFFTMLLSLGLGSQIGLLEGMLCTLFDIDIFKRLRKQYVTGKCFSDRTMFLRFNYSFSTHKIATVCICCFLIGLIFCTGAGEYWLKMFDSFAGTIGLVVIALMEMIAVIYIYGHEK